MTKDKETHLEPVLNEHWKLNTEYITQFKSIAWGLDHGLIVDNKYKVYSMGTGKYGRLGHGDEEDKKRPTLIKELSDHKIIDV